MPKRCSRELVTTDTGDEATGLGYFGLLLAEKDDLALPWDDPTEVGREVHSELQIQGAKQVASCEQAPTAEVHHPAASQ